MSGEMTPNTVSPTIHYESPTNGNRWSRTRSARCSNVVNTPASAVSSDHSRNIKIEYLINMSNNIQGPNLPIQETADSCCAADVPIKDGTPASPQMEKPGANRDQNAIISIQITMRMTSRIFVYNSQKQ